MPEPFRNITVEQFARMLSFPWKRKIDAVHIHNTWRPQFRAIAVHGRSRRIRWKQPKCTGRPTQWHGWYAASTTRQFGLAAPDDPRLQRDVVEPPVIESIRSSRRTGPDGQIEFDLIAEITQVRYARMSDGRVFPFHGGTTVITGPNGDVRYTVVKGIASSTRLPRQVEFLASPQGQRLWTDTKTNLAPAADPFQLLHSTD